MVLELEPDFYKNVKEFERKQGFRTSTEFLRASISQYMRLANIEDLELYGKNNKGEKVKYVLLKPFG